MADTVRDARLDVPRKMLAAALRDPDEDCKPLALAEWRERIGQAIERALVLARISKQDASHRMGYPAGDQSAISRWIAGTERPQFDKLFTIAALRKWIPIALAELDEDAEMTVTVRRRA